MHATTFRKVGGSVMMAVPPAILEALNIKPGDAGTIDTQNGQIIAAPVKRAPRGRRTVAQLLAGINPQDVAEWRESIADDLTSEPVGKEII